MQKSAQLLILTLSSGAFNAAFAQHANSYNTSTVLKHLNYNSKIHHQAEQQRKAWQKPVINGEPSQAHIRLTSARPTPTAKNTNPKQFPGVMWKPKKGSKQWPGEMYRPKKGSKNFPGEMWKGRNKANNPKQFPGEMWKPKN